MFPLVLSFFFKEKFCNIIESSVEIELSQVGWRNYYNLVRNLISHQRGNTDICEEIVSVREKR